ncbi:MAG: hypothetical protein KBG15_09695 [Kofleriaceae bacterium]|nr:hypothetical protein [Kofleriaceae bacterium]
MALRMWCILSLGLVLAGCGHGASSPPSSSPPSPQPSDAALRPVGVLPQAVAPEALASPRCVRAGGRCVGPSAIAANPVAPCAAGMHRVDDVKIPGGPVETRPACWGIPLGEEACCMPD